MLKAHVQQLGLVTPEPLDAQGIFGAGQFRPAFMK